MAASSIGAEYRNSNDIRYKKVDLSAYVGMGGEGGGHGKHIEDQDRVERGGGGLGGGGRDIPAERGFSSWKLGQTLISLFALPIDDSFALQENEARDSR